MKPVEPTPDFPLFAHGNGQWARKVHGKLRYYRLWADPHAAFAKHQADTIALRPTPNNSDSITSSPMSAKSPQFRKPTPNSRYTPMPLAVGKEDSREGLLLRHLGGPPGRPE